MSLIRPFAGLRPAPGRARDVAAPPYDVLSSEEARARASGKPWSFLHISKPEIDLPPGTDPHSPAVYAKAAENLARMIEARILQRDPPARYYAYRLVLGDHVQIGLVAAAAVTAYDDNRIRRHELTRPDKEDDRVRQIDALNAHTGPVLLAYRTAPQVDQILREAVSATPDADLQAEDGVRHTIWPISDPDRISTLTATFDDMPALYIADGHHRSAAASRVAAARRARTREHTGEESYEYFLVVAFPDHQMKILPYHRVAADLNGMCVEGFLERVQGGFNVEASATPVAPDRPGQFGVYVGGRWYRLFIRHGLIPIANPVARLDVSLLTDHLLGPILGIHDLRRDGRIDFVGGIRGLPELERRVDSGQMAVAFSMHPTRMEDLMAVADQGLTMPPKSTWFEPKLADGLVSHVLD